MWFFVKQLQTVDSYYEDWSVDTATCSCAEKPYFQEANKDSGKRSRKRKRAEAPVDAVASQLGAAFPAIREKLRVELAACPVRSLTLSSEFDADFDAWLQLRRLVLKMSSGTSTGSIFDKQLAASELAVDDNKIFSTLISNGSSVEIVLPVANLTFILPAHSSFLMGDVFLLLAPKPKRSSSAQGLQAFNDNNVDNNMQRKFDLIVMDPPWLSKSVSRVGF